MDLKQIKKTCKMFTESITQDQLEAFSKETKIHFNDLKYFAGTKD